MRFLIVVGGDNLTQGERNREFEEDSLEKARKVASKYPDGSKLWVDPDALQTRVHLVLPGLAEK